MVAGIALFSFDTREAGALAAGVHGGRDGAERGEEDERLGFFSDRRDRLGAEGSQLILIGRSLCP
jgi:hypothetical protein